MKIYNSLSREIEEFKSIKPNEVGMYTCGPTVYSYVSIGNWRTYFLGDLLARVFKYLDYKVKYVMNITDVGHLTGDNLGDADLGEDRLEKASGKTGKSAWEIAEFYSKDFIEGYQKLNLVMPSDNHFCRATKYIPEQIELVRQIEAKGFTYKVEDGIYFDVKAYEEAGNKYGELSTLDEIKEGARVKTEIEKRNPRDFALWKFSPKDAKRQMEWESPWGVGFPGWHVECSAMSMKHLGESFDVHVGGEDLKSTHHPNEIAQSESVTGKKFVNYWVHGAFLQVDGGRMGKSLGNAYTLQDLEEKGFSPMDLKYFYLTGHYRKPLNFTFSGLEAAKTARMKLASMAKDWLDKAHRTKLSEEKLSKVQEYSRRFDEAMESDLATPQALAVVWEMVKSNIPEQDKKELLMDWDIILGLNLFEGPSPKKVEVPEEVKELMEKRESLRKEKKWEEADKLREEIVKRGFRVEDR